MQKQILFIEHSCCFVTQSKAIAVKRKHSRERLSPGQGAYVGGRGFAKGTELFYSGLIYHGEYNENLMVQAWNQASQIRLPEDWKGKVFMVESQKLYIIGHPEAWTSALNFPGHNSPYHASIIGQKAIIKFDHAAFSFEEIFVDYAEHLTLTSHPVVKRKAAIALEDISLATAQGAKLRAIDIIKEAYNAKDITDPEIVHIISQKNPNTESTWEWYEEKETKFDFGPRQRKKPNNAPGTVAPPLDVASSSTSADSTAASSSTSAVTPHISTATSSSTSAVTHNISTTAFSSTSDVTHNISTAASSSTSAVNSGSNKRGPLSTDSNQSPLKKTTMVIDLTQLTEEQLAIIAEKYQLVKKKPQQNNHPALFKFLNVSRIGRTYLDSAFLKDFKNFGLGLLQNNNSLNDEIVRLRPILQQHYSNL